MSSKKLSPNKLTDAIGLVVSLAPTGGDAPAGVITIDTSSGSSGKCRPVETARRLVPAKPVVHARQHLVDVRELERGRGGIPIFKLRAPIRSKAIFDACSECPADPFIRPRTFKFARKAADNAK